ncbi:MAG: hypothetical protein AAF676_11190 [Pseudomonadota bacterium]
MADPDRPEDAEDEHDPQAALEDFARNRHPALVAPGVYEFQPHRTKLWILCAALGFVSAWLASLVLAPPSGIPPEPAFIGLAVALSVAAAWACGRSAADPRPVLRVDAEALEDRVHGRILWSDVESWSERRSMVSPGFGWTLKRGLQPPENAYGYRIQSRVNWIAGVPGRSYRRKLIAGGTEPMAVAFRVLHPELER